MTEDLFARLTLYEIRNLPYHLGRAGRFADLHRLLALDAPDGRNAWLEAKERIGQIAGFLDDIRYARNLAGADTTAPYDGRLDAVSAARVLRYALMEASLSEAAENIPDVLFEALVENGIWPMERAIAMAGQIRQPSKRSLALARLGKYGNDPSTMYQEAIRASEDIADDVERAETIPDLANALPSELAGSVESTFSPDFVSKIDSLRYPQLQFVFARRFSNLNQEEEAHIRKLLSKIDDTGVVADGLMRFIGMSAEGISKNDKEYDYDMKPMKGKQLSETEVDLQKLQYVVARPHGWEELAAAFTGMLIASKWLIEDPVAAALRIIEKMPIVDVQLVFLARLAAASPSPEMVAETAMELVKRAKFPSYLTALALGNLVRFVPDEKIHAYVLSAVGIVLKHPRKGADRFLAGKVGERWESRTVLLARLVSRASRLVQDVVLPVCVEYSRFTELEEDDPKGHEFRMTFHRDVHRALLKATGDPEYEVSATIDLPNLDERARFDRARILCDIAAAMPDDTKRAIVSLALQVAEAGLGDGTELADTFTSLARQVGPSNQLAAATEAVRLLTIGATTSAPANAASGRWYNRPPDLDADARQHFYSTAVQLMPTVAGFDLAMKVADQSSDDLVLNAVLPGLPPEVLAELLHRTKKVAEDTRHSTLVVKIACELGGTHQVDVYDEAIEALLHTEEYSLPLGLFVDLLTAAPKNRIADVLHCAGAWRGISGEGASVDEWCEMYAVAGRASQSSTERASYLQRALEMSLHSFDLVRRNVLLIGAPLVDTRLAPLVDKVLRTLALRDRELAMAAIVAQSPDSVCRKYLRRLLWSIRLGLIWKRLTGKDKRESERRRILNLIEPTLTRRQVLWLMNAVRGHEFGYGRLQLLGDWRTALKLAQSRTDPKIPLSIMIDALPMMTPPEQGAARRLIVERVQGDERGNRLPRPAAIELVWKASTILPNEEWRGLAMKLLADVLNEPDDAERGEGMRLLKSFADRAPSLPPLLVWEAIASHFASRSRGGILSDLQILFCHLTVGQHQEFADNALAAVIDVNRWWPA